MKYTINHRNWYWETIENFGKISNDIYFKWKPLGISASELMDLIEIEFNAFKVNSQWVYTPSKLKICKGGKNIGSVVGSDDKCI